MKRSGFAFFHRDVLLAHDQHSTEHVFCEVIGHRPPSPGETARHGYAPLNLSKRLSLIHI